MPSFAALISTIIGFIIINHIMNSFSAIGRIMMLTGAMGEGRIFEEEEEEKMSPRELSDALLYRYRIAKRCKVDVMKQYTVDYQELIHDVEHGKLKLPISPEEYTDRKSKLMTRRATQTLYHTGLPSKALRSSDNSVDPFFEEGLSSGIWMETVNEEGSNCSSTRTPLNMND